MPNSWDEGLRVQQLYESPLELGRTILENDAALPTYCVCMHVDPTERRDGPRVCGPRCFQGLW